MGSDIAGITLGRTDTALKVSLSGEIDTAPSQGSWFIRIRKCSSFSVPEKNPWEKQLRWGKDLLCLTISEASVCGHLAPSLLDLCQGRNGVLQEQSTSDLLPRGSTTSQ